MRVFSTQLDTKVVTYQGRPLCKVGLLDLQANFPLSLRVHVEERPVASNYVFENDFEVGGYVGTIFAHKSAFSESASPLSHHLKLRDATPESALLFELSWLN